MERILNGKYNRDEILDAQREAEIQLKTVNQYVQIFGVASKNERAMLTLKKKGIMDGFTAISLPKDGEIYCQDRGVSISKEECLDYSGSNLDTCSGCDMFVHSRKVLLGEAK
jgi:hypothetical protein